MSDSLILVLMAVVGAFIILGLAVYGYSRFADHGGAVPVPVAFREPGGRWRRGRLKVDGDTLELKASGQTPGPWVRGRLDLGYASSLPEADADEIGREGLIRVPVTYGSTEFELALDEHHYTALRAWVEAVPPGWNSQVA